MSLINGALVIGRSALMSYQSALQVVGNNVSNAGNADYTRQSPILRAQGGVELQRGLMPGGGVALTDLKRNIDESVENRLRFAVGDQAGITAEQQTLSRIESVMNELTDADISTLMQQFFNAFSSLQNQPHDVTQRGLAIQAGDSLTTELHRQREDLLSLRDELNQSISGAVEHAGGLINEIARLNKEIAGLEAGGSSSASTLRDQRDAALKGLAELVQIETREQPNGVVNVYIGNEPVIQGTHVRGIEAELETINGEPRMVTRFADSDSPIELRGGMIEGLVRARDEHVQGYLNQLDGFASSLISEVNRLHSPGQGLDALTSVVGSNAIADPTAALNASGQGMAIVPRNGSFQITVWDTKNQPPTGTTKTIRVDLNGNGAESSMQSVVDQINTNVNGVVAAINAQNQLTINSTEGYEFTFGQDSSNFLAASGVNAFFTGSNTQDIQVNAMLADNPRLLAAAQNFTDGDGSNALALAALEITGLKSLNGRSLTDIYNAMTSEVAVKGAAAVSGVAAAGAIHLALQAQSESISGVSLDEETVSMLRLERAFQGAARYTSAVDQMMQELLSIAR